ncbi:MAG: MoaD/ThiS family protein [Chloroflexota bacterium]
MGKVRLKVPPWIGIMLKAQASDWSTLEIEAGTGTTISALLAKLAKDNPDFSKTVFNPDTMRANSLINIFLNDSLLQSTEINAAKLKEGDTLLILPLYAGG